MPTLPNPRPALRPLLHPTLVTLLTALFAFLLMALYLGGELRGNLNWSILPSAQYEIPQAETARGFEPLYIKRGESGWDGQFYYYISNDLLAQTDAKYKVEMAPYRYQRIGVSLVAKIASTLLGYDYVPVPVFYLTSAFLVLAASFLFASFLQARGFSPYLSLLWSLAAGTQLTVLNGLPDAGADAFLLIALTALFEKKLWLYIPAITLCTLSREIYVLIPASIGLATLIDSRKKLFTAPVFLRLVKLGMPLVIFCGWQLYLKLHFADVPAINTLNEKLTTLWPMEQLLFFLVSALRSKHQIFGGVPFESYELANLLSFMFLLCGSFAILIYFLSQTKKNKISAEKPLFLGLSGGFFILFTLYLFLGETVMRHHTGFLKVIPVCFICILFCFVGSQNKMTKPVLAFLMLCFLMPQPTLLLRVLKEPSTLQQYRGIFDPSLNEKALLQQEPCIEKLSAEISYAGHEDFYKSRFFADILKRPQTKILYVNIKNKSPVALPIAIRNGATIITYYWKTLGSNGLVFGNALPTVFQKPLNPEEARIFPIIVSRPETPYPLALHLFVTQAGCPSADNAFTNALDLSVDQN